MKHTLKTLYTAMAEKGYYEGIGEYHSLRRELVRLTVRRIGNQDDIYEFKKPNFIVIKNGKKHSTFINVKELLGENKP